WIDARCRQVEEASRNEPAKAGVPRQERPGGRRARRRREHPDRDGRAGDRYIAERQRDRLVVTPCRGVRPRETATGEVPADAGAGHPVAERNLGPPKREASGRVERRPIGVDDLPLHADAEIDNERADRRQLSCTKPASEAPRVNRRVPSSRAVATCCWVRGK